MKCFRSIDTGHHMAVLSLHGAVTARDFCDATDSMLHSPEFQPGFSTLWDLRNARLKNPCRQFVGTLIHYAEKIQTNRGLNYKVAIVVNNEVDYGYMRMLCEYAVKMPAELRVFRFISDAFQWIHPGVLV
ncbi:hypothetical protein JW835_04785 [bacterium]|nr:hypothetical protein [bacterium]